MGSWSRRLNIPTLIGDAATTPASQLRLLEALLGQKGVTIAGFAAAVLMGSLVWFDQHWAWIFAWISGVGLTTLARLRLRSASGVTVGPDEHPGPAAIERWIKRIILTTWGIGFSWGLLGFVILTTSHDDALKIILFITSSGIVAGGATRNHASPAAAYGQLLLIEVPIAAGSFIGATGWTYDIVGVLILLNIAATSSTIRHLQSQTVTILRADNANAALVAELHRANEALEVNNLALEGLAITDDLTGLRNRRGLMMTLEGAWRNALRETKAVGVIIIDIDHFKRFNDRYGHLEGDACLRAVAHCLAGALYRADDSICRYGGEEFVVVLPCVSHADAEMIAERMRLAVLDLAIPHQSSDHEVVTISIGIAVAKPDGTDELLLLTAADTALYQAKQSGRNCWRGTRPEPADQAAFAMLRST